MGPHQNSTRIYTDASQRGFTRIFIGLKKIRENPRCFSIRVNPRTSFLNTLHELFRFKCVA